MRPNLFQFATSELSQDAFLCWLLSWANESHRQYDEDLHSVAIAFLSLIYERVGAQLPNKINSIDVRKQDGGIDILCIVNNETAIIIEDKLGTKQHSDQLARYKDHVLKLGYQANKILAIYLQTGDQSDFREVEKHGYAVLERKDLLHVIESEQAEIACHKSDVLSDFSKYLRLIEDDVKSFIRLPPKEWSWNSWKGFYTALQGELKGGHWDYVANPSGGFLGFWWHSNGDDQCEQYLQLEQEKFCFKIWVADPKMRGTLRNNWHNKIIKECQRHGIKAKRPDRFGSGEYMTVATLNQEFRVVDDSGLLDMQQTIKVIRAAEMVLDSLNVQQGR